MTAVQALCPTCDVAYATGTILALPPEADLPPAQRWAIGEPPDVTYYNSIPPCPQCGNKLASVATIASFTRCAGHGDPT